jgi:hypothetical protein
VGHPIGALVLMPGFGHLLFDSNLANGDGYAVDVTFENLYIKNSPGAAIMSTGKDVTVTSCKISDIWPVYAKFVTINFMS